MQTQQTARAPWRGLLAAICATAYGCGDGNSTSGQSDVVDKVLGRANTTQLASGKSPSPQPRPGTPAAAPQGLVTEAPALRPGPPRNDDGRGGVVGGALVAPSRGVAKPTDCVVDFTDSTALQLTGPSLYGNWVLIPWYQQCGGAGYVDFRPLTQGHFHLGFADPAVQFCNTHPQNYPARLDPDGTCHLVDIATEPRTDVLPHVGQEVFLLRAQGVSGNWASFDLNKFRVRGERAVKLCYRKSALDWEAPAGSDGAEVGWLCWDRLEPGLWDLSAYASELREVKITESLSDQGIFKIDDFHIAIRN